MSSGPGALLASTLGSWILPLLGAVIELLLGGGIADGTAQVRVSARDVTIIKGKTKRRFARAQVSSVVLDEGHLVLRDARDADLIRQGVDVPEAEQVTTLRRYGWPTENAGAAVTPNERCGPPRSAG